MGKKKKKKLTGCHSDFKNIVRFISKLQIFQNLQISVTSNQFNYFG